MGEGIVDWEGFAFEANSGSCGGTSPPPDMVWTPGKAVGLAHCCLGGGTIPGDRLIGIQGGWSLGVGLSALVRRPINTVVVGIFLTGGFSLHLCHYNRVDAIPKG